MKDFIEKFEDHMVTTSYVAITIVVYSGFWVLVTYLFFI